MVAILIFCAESCLTLCSPCQAPLSMEIFQAKTSCRGCPSTPGDLPDPGMKPMSLASSLRWQVDSLPLWPPGKPSAQ